MDASPSNHGRGLLWEISAPGMLPSYVFGTMHSADRRVIATLEHIRPSLHKVSMVCTEILFDFRTLGKVNNVMFFHDGRTLSPLIGRGLFERSAQALTHYGYNRDKANQMKPWAVILILSYPDTEVDSLDEQIADEAALSQKKVCGLEDVTEQANAFNGLSMHEQISLLRETLAQLPNLEQMYQELIGHYVARNLDGIVKLSEKYAFSDKKLMDKFMYRLVDERNERMIRRMIPRMRQGSVLFAVGALHLHGQNGLLSLLEIEGFTVKPVY